MALTPSTLSSWDVGSAPGVASPTLTSTLYVPLGTAISQAPGRATLAKLVTLLPCMCMSVSTRWSGDVASFRSRPLPTRLRGVAVAGTTQPKPRTLA